MKKGSSKNFFRRQPVAPATAPHYQRILSTFVALFVTLRHSGKRAEARDSSGFVPLQCRVLLPLPPECSARQRSVPSR